MINERSAIDITNEQVRNKLRKPAGTKINIAILRNDLKDLINYEITRAKIPLYSVDTHFMRHNITGHVSISRFAENTYDKLTNELRYLKQKGIKQLILDLRSNPGGYLNQVVKISNLFLDDNKEIVYTKGRLKEFDEVYYASQPALYKDLPSIILVNKGSASASEIVADAMQNWDKALITENILIQD